MADTGSAHLLPDSVPNIMSDSTACLSEKQKARLVYLSERAGIGVEEAIAKNMSQRQLKKMASTLRYQQILRSKRTEEKEKRKKFRRENKLRDGCVPKTKKQHVLMKDSTNKVSVVIDLNFSDLMSAPDSKKLRKQINRCYSVNRSADAPVHLYLTSCSQKMRDELNGSNSGFDNWDIHVSDLTYEQVFFSDEQRKSLVYLTRDSDNVLPDASHIKSSADIYVIGGLVDHNAHKNLTLTRAESLKIRHARLPIDEHLKMCRTQVLTVNQVFELMLLVSQGTEWPQALLTIIPQRKIHPYSKLVNAELSKAAGDHIEESADQVFGKEDTSDSHSNKSCV